QQAFAVEVPGKEGDEVTGRPIYPVEVLEDQRDRRIRRQIAEQPEQQAEQARLAETAARVRGLVAGRAGSASSRCGIADTWQEPADLVLGGTEDLGHPFGRQVAEVAAEGLGER